MQFFGKYDLHKYINIILVLLMFYFRFIWLCSWCSVNLLTSLVHRFNHSTYCHSSVHHFVHSCVYCIAYLDGHLLNATHLLCYSLCDILMYVFCVLNSLYSMHIAILFGRFSFSVIIGSCFSSEIIPWHMFFFVCSFKIRSSAYNMVAKHLVFSYLH